jgi:hypothetical protein
MLMRALVLAALCGQGAALMQPALLRTARPMAVAPRAAAPEMLLGGAGRSFRTAILNVRRTVGIKNSAPGGTGGSVGGSGAGGGTGGGITPAGDGDKGDNVNPFVAVWKNYEALLEEKPLLMKALTSFTGFAIGDILAQIFIQKQEFDWSAHACRRPASTCLHKSLTEGRPVLAFATGTASSASRALASWCTAPRPTGSTASWMRPSPALAPSRSSPRCSSIRCGAHNAVYLSHPVRRARGGGASACATVRQSALAVARERAASRIARTRLRQAALRLPSA